jgi:hypothetical protein
MRRAFVLVDLWSQADYIPRKIRRWPRERILQWLAQYGEVWQVLTPMDDSAFWFRSWWGISATFRLTQDGQLTLIGDHFMVPVWQDHDGIM